MTSKREPPKRKPVKRHPTKPHPSTSPPPRGRRAKPDTRSRAALADELTAAALEAVRNAEANPLADELEAKHEVDAPVLLLGPSETAKPTSARSSAGADLFALVEKKLRGRIEVPGLGKRRRRKVAMHAAADAYVASMVAGSFKFDRDFLDRSLGKPVQRHEVGANAVHELREWLTTPGPAQLGLGVELARLLKLARSLRSPAGREVADNLAGLLASVGAGDGEATPPTDEPGT